MKLMQSGIPLHRLVRMKISTEVFIIVVVSSGAQMVIWEQDQLKKTLSDVVTIYYQSLQRTVMAKNWFSVL